MTPHIGGASSCPLLVIGRLNLIINIQRGAHTFDETFSNVPNTNMLSTTEGSPYVGTLAPSQFIIDFLEESDCKDYLIIWSTLRRRNWNRRNKFRYGSHWTQYIVFRKCHHLSNTTKNSNFVVRLALRHQLRLCS